MTPSARIVRNSLVIATAVGAIVAAGGILVMIGWAFDIAWLKTITLGYVSMKPNAALCFFLCGTALLTRSPLLNGEATALFPTRSFANWIFIACIALVACIALATIVEYLFGVDLRIDSIILHEAIVSERTAFPGRMSPATATEFALFSAAIVGLDKETRRGLRPAQYLAILLTLIAFVALLGYLYDVKVLYAVNVYATMALHTVIFFLLLGVGLLFMRPDKGIMADLTNRRVGATMARHILPFAISIPIAVGWLRLMGERAGWYGGEFGLAIFATCNIVIFAFLVWRYARVLNRSDVTRIAAEAVVESTAHELRETTHLLEAIQERHRLAVEAAGLGTWYLDLTTEILSCSDSCLRLYGFAPGTIVTRQHLRDVIHPDDRESVTQLRQRIEQGESKFEVEYRIVWPDQSEHWLAVKGEGYYDQAGHATNMQGVAMDVTARKTSEHNHERLQGQLRQAQKLNALGTLAAGIAHDFNNVLTAISGNVALVSEALADDQPVAAQESLAEIGKASRRATELVNRILAFSRGQDGRPTAMQLQPIIDETIKLLRASVPAMIELRVRCADNVPNVFVDATQIHEVVMNIATNAVHAIGNRHGVIEFVIDTVKVNGDLAHTFAELAEGRYVRLAISDDGCGMDKAVSERIFEPFYTTKVAGRGTGLGLSVVHGIVKSAQGTITVYSQLGKGTKFHIYLPVTDEIAANDTHIESGIAYGNGEHVLYVDDEEALIFLVTRLLKRYNYRVAGYTDAAHALATFRNAPHSFDVVVTDLSMPQMSGFEFAESVRRIRPDVPVILTSGYLRREDVEKASVLGISELIAKPNTVEELGRSLTRMFAAKSSN